MSDPWSDLTEAQRQQIREAHAEAKKREASFTCPRCGMTSHNPEDAREGYCGNCHDWTGPHLG